MGARVETFPSSVEQAEGAYGAQGVPLQSGPWARPPVDAAGIEPGQAVLDVACRTGVVVRAAADRVADGGVVGGTPLEGRISAEVYERILVDTRTGFARYRDPTGALHLPTAGALVTAEPA